MSIYRSTSAIVFMASIAFAGSAAADPWKDESGKGKWRGGGYERYGGNGYGGGWDGPGDRKIKMRSAEGGLSAAEGVSRDLRFPSRRTSATLIRAKRLSMPRKSAAALATEKLPCSARPVPPSDLTRRLLAVATAFSSFAGLGGSCASSPSITCSVVPVGDAACPTIAGKTNRVLDA
jgi:hypothetical protein